jgi:hypothetical protein
MQMFLAPAADGADETRLKIEEPDIIRPSISDVVSAKNFQ